MVGVAKDDPVDWADPILTRWMGSITRKSTAKAYRAAFRRYAAFTGEAASVLVDEALEDARRDPRDKQGIVKQRLLKFYHHLKDGADKKIRRGNVTKQDGKGLSDKYAHLCVNAVRSFYATYDISVKLTGRSRLPRARVENKRLKIANTDVARLVNHARTLRDRAILLTLFQGGMDVSTLCELKYKDVAAGLDGEAPMKLELYRPKTGTEFFTFLGKDAMRAIRAYLADTRRNVTFDYNTPLFLKGVYTNGAEALEPHLVQMMMKDLAKKAGFVDAKNNGRHFNPLGPHALRESFGSILINSGVPDTIVDFFLGHEIGEMAEAYKGVQFDSLRKIYAEREALLSITSEGGAIKEELQAEIEKRGELQSLVLSLAKENREAKERMEALEKMVDALSGEVRGLIHAYEEPIEKDLAESDRDRVEQDRKRVSQRP
jgi:site-specific recombinase XerD